MFGKTLFHHYFNHSNKIIDFLFRIRLHLSFKNFGMSFRPSILFLDQVFVHDICQIDNLPTIFLYQPNNIHVTLYGSLSLTTLHCYMETYALFIVELFFLFFCFYFSFNPIVKIYNLFPKMNLSTTQTLSSILANI